MKPLTQKIVTHALFLVIFLTIFSFTITNVAAPYIAGDLGASNDIATYTISFFAFGNAIGMPLSRILSCKIGTARLFNLCLLFFAITTELCALTENYTQIVIIRFFQGMACGPLFPMVIRMIPEINPTISRERTLLIVILLSTLGPALGASWGGIIAYELTWQVFFHINTPIIIALLLLFHFTLKDIPFKAPEAAYNFLGYISYALMIICIGGAITLGQFLDWQRSNLILSMFGVGLFSLIFYILWDTKQEHPIVHLQLFKVKTFSFAMVILSILFSAYFGMVLLLGLWLKLDAQYTGDWIGLIMGHMILAGLLLARFLPKINKLDPRFPLLIAILFFVISCFYTTQFSVDIDFFRIALSRVLAGFGLALFLAPIMNICLRHLKEEQTADGMMIFQIIRSFSSGIGAAAYTTVWWRRAVFYHERLGEQLTPFSQLTKNYLESYRPYHIDKKGAIDHMSRALNLQSNALALDDTFYLMAWVCLLGVVMIAMSFAKKNLLDIQSQNG